MATTLNDWFMIASGANNTDDLLPLHQISPPLFSDYSPKGGVLTDWHNAEAYQVDGLGRQVNIGFPYVDVTLFNLSIDEYVLLQQFFGDVTIHTFNKKTGLWTNYSGTLDFKDEGTRDWDLDQWDKVTLSIRFLQAVV